MSILKPRLRYLLFYVTSRCNLRCRHCFYLDELNRHSEMTLAEIEKIAAALRPLSFLRITGGEPLLRQDLPEVISAFHHGSATPRMGVITNGTKPEKMEALVRRIFELSPELVLDIGVSIDGLREVHDEIRGLRGSFDRARKTVETLVQLQPRYPNLLTSLVITVTAKNEPHLDDLYAEISRWGVRRLSVNHVRGKVDDPSLLEVPFERYSEFARKCENYHLDQDRSWKANLQRAKNRLAREAIAQVAAGEKSALPCLAGSSIGVLYSDGEVNVCELLKGELPADAGTGPAESCLGNIREVEYDFYRIWHSLEAENCRRWIRAVNCSCTHECFLTASILFGKKNYLRLAQEWWRLSRDGHGD